MIRERVWNDTTRTYTEYDENGQVTSSRAYTEAENAAADAAVAAEQARAEQEKLAADTEAVVRAMVATAQPPADGQPYVAPTGYQNAYAKDTTCTYAGKTWRALRDGAVGVPGESPGDWQQVAGPGEIVDWVQPQAGSEYPVGAIVRHNGHLWRNDHTGPNGWEPGTTGSQWTDLGPTD